MSTAGLLPKRRALHPYVRQRLAGQFAELASHQEGMAVTLQTLAACEPPLPLRLRLMLTGHAMQCEREAATSRLMGRRLGSRECPREEVSLTRPRARRPSEEGEEARWYLQLSTCYILHDGVLITTAVAALRNDLQAVAASDELAEALASMADAAAARRAEAWEALEGAVHEHGSGIFAACLNGVGGLVRVLVGPDRPTVMPMNPVALKRRACTLIERWNAARERAVELLTSVGLPTHDDEVRRHWRSATLTALAEHHRLWGREHCVAQAAAAGLLSPTMPGSQTARAAALPLHPGD